MGVAEVEEDVEAVGESVPEGEGAADQEVEGLTVPVPVTHLVAVAVAVGVGDSVPLPVGRAEGVLSPEGEDAGVMEVAADGDFAKGGARFDAGEGVWRDAFAAADGAANGDCAD